MAEAQVIDVDVAIVGSGAGGGTVAAQLAPLCVRGLRVAVFEWGGHFAAADNTRRELEMVRRYYVDGGGLRTVSGEITLAACRAVGGATNVYTGVSFFPPPHVLDKWAVPGLNIDDLAPRLARHAADNGVHYHVEAEINRNNQLFAQGCRALGWTPRTFPINTRGCAGLGTCNLGCPRQAKQGTAQVQLPRAERQGVKIFPYCRIDRIDNGVLLGEVEAPPDGLRPGPLSPGKLQVRARRIVLAGGALFTPTLLMRSFADAMRRWPALGRYFTCHPALTLVGLHDTPVDGPIGHPKSFYCDDFARQEGFLLESCFYPPFATARNLVGLGDDLDRMMGRIDHQQQVLALVLDRAQPTNRIVMGSDGGPRIHYAVDAALRATLASAIRASGRLLFAAGARCVHLPGTQAFLSTHEEADRLGSLVAPARLKAGRVTISAAHLMGGCRMGTQAAASVTDA